VWHPIKKALEGLVVLGAHMLIAVGMAPQQWPDVSWAPRVIGLVEGAIYGPSGRSFGAVRKLVQARGGTYAIIEFADGSMGAAPLSMMMLHLSSGAMATGSEAARLAESGRQLAVARVEFVGTFLHLEMLTPAKERP
jgi:hypothetical protein